MNQERTPLPDADVEALFSVQESAVYDEKAALAALDEWAEQVERLDQVAQPLCSLCEKKFATTTSYDGSPLCNGCQYKLAKEIRRQARAARLAKRRPETMAIPKERRS